MDVTERSGRPDRPVDTRSRVLVRVATAGLVAVLLSLAVGATWAVADVNRSIREVELASAQRSAWVLARYEVSQEKAIAYAYLVAPSTSLRDQLERAREAVDSALGFMIDQGEPDDSADARRVKATHDAIVGELRRMLDAIDRAGGSSPAAVDRAAQAELDTQYSTLQAEVGTIAVREDAEVSNTLHGLRARQDSLLLASYVGGGLGLVAVAVFLLVLLGYQGRLVRQAADSRHQALHDPLTGLPNRELLADRVEQAIKGAERQLRPAALLLLDLDRFKDVNDTLGHHHGDRLLVEVAERLTAALRRVDTVARLGGDEFAVLLPDTGAEAAAVVAGKLRAALHQPLTLDGVGLDLEASVGAAIYPDHGATAAELLQHADVAMYAAKHAHAGFIGYDPAVDQHSPRRLALLGGLRRAIDRDELILWYQPKADLRSGRVSGVEALVRWQHPDHGLLPPVEFIPLAERTGLIHPLTQWVLDKALDQAASWFQEGRDLSVAVNVSTRSLLDPTFPEQVAQQLAARGLPSRLLVLELTESAVMSDPARALEVLSQLHALGTGLAVDDFGTGYSSMVYLKQLPVDELKIDRSFVSQMTSNSSDAVIVRSTIDLGHNLGLRVVAEGVETRDAWDQLASFGCDSVQGYHLGKPMTPADLEQWLREQAEVKAARA